MNLTNKIDMNDKSTYPKDRGQYLITYKDSAGMEYYQIVYYWPENDEKSEGRVGFYIDQDCEMRNEITKAYGWIPLKYEYLPNLWREDGKYL